MSNSHTGLCPICGAYWACDCPKIESRFEKPQVEELPREPVSAGCNHDWQEVVSVDLEGTAYPDGARVVACRFCGLYAVQAGA
jgi:hypothetical protein